MSNSGHHDKPKTFISTEQLSSLNNHTHLRDISSSLTLDYEGTNTPRSVKTFEELKLNSQLLKGLYDMGFRRPSPIQECALPQLLADPPRNMIAQFPTGTGKTATFSLATLSHIDPNLNYAQALILSPTFEHCLQIGKVIENMAKFSPHIKIAYAVRDPIISKRKEHIKGKELNVSIVIGTLGTIMDFAKQIIENPVIFRLKSEAQSLSKMRQLYIECNNDEDKYNAIKTIYSSITIGQSIMFCRDQRSAHALELGMRNNKQSVESFSSESTTEQRAAVINRFRDKKFRVLIAINVCACEIDIDDISLVFNFEFPLIYDDIKRCFIDKPDYDTYLHRIGLAGRSGHVGYTFNLITPSEKYLLKQVENYFQERITEFSETYTADDELYKFETTTSTIASDSLTLSTQPTRLSFTGSEPRSISQLSPQPSGFPFNGGQTPVTTLPQQSTRGSAATNTVSAFAASFPRTSTPEQTLPLQFTKTSRTDASNLAPSNLSSVNPSPFTFGNLQPRQPLGTSRNLNTMLNGQDDYVIDLTDFDTPFYSSKKFHDLNLKPDLLRGILNMNFRSPSKIQAITVPYLLRNPPRNIIAQSQSGTGKTVAFSLAILSRIDPYIQSPQALILVPTFELAIQVGSVIEKIAQFLPRIKIAYAVLDPDISKRSSRVYGQLLPEPIVIGTPGTIEEWCRKMKIIQLNKLRICCIDEADVIVGIEGFRQFLHRLDPSNCQMILFSTTYSRASMMFARRIVPNSITFSLKHEKQMLANIRQFFIRCDKKGQKYNAIEQMYVSLTIGQAMIFCQTKATALDLAIRMELANHSVREIMSILDTKQRETVIKKFREGIFRVLISTNIAARGLDIHDVTLVINYDMPVTVNSEPDHETYLHRIGRCGRFGKFGYVFNLIDSEKDFNIMKSIKQHFKHRIDEIAIEDINQLEEIE